MTKQIRVGSVAVGAGAPVAIQSMCNTNTADVAATVAQILALDPDFVLLSSETTRTDSHVALARSWLWSRPAARSSAWLCRIWRLPPPSAPSSSRSIFLW